MQGVGFRYSVKQIAKGFSVTGWIRNLADGRVELQIAGDAEEITEFLKAINESELRGHIRETSETTLMPAPEFRGFEIRHD